MKVHEITREKDGWWWIIPRSKTKNAWRDGSTDLCVPLGSRALTIVQRRIQAVQKGYLFASNGASGHVEQKTVNAMVWARQPYSMSKPEYERTRLPVTHWSVHDLRRTGRTQLTALGCYPDVAEAVIGHMPSGISGVYNLHRYDRERREWLSKLSEHYERLSAIERE